MKQMLKTSLKDLRQVQDVELPRYVGTEPRYQIHAFTDASKNAFACARVHTWSKWTKHNSILHDG